MKNSGHHRGAGGDNRVVRASLAPHREHLSRPRISDRQPVPQSRAISKSSTVRAVPQLPHSIFSSQPKRTRSAALRMCFVDIWKRYARQNDS